MELNPARSACHGLPPEKSGGRGKSEGSFSNREVLHHTIPHTAGFISPCHAKVKICNHCDQCTNSSAAFRRNSHPTSIRNSNNTIKKYSNREMVESPPLEVLKNHGDVALWDIISGHGVVMGGQLVILVVFSN